MRIGFSSIYSWRPHVGQLYFLANLAKKDGHSVFFLTCDADLPACYTRELRDKRPAWQECVMCRIGGMRSYTRNGITSIGSAAKEPLLTLPVNSEAWALSSASTLGRFESNADFESDEFLSIANRLLPSTQISYAAALSWIKKEQLDAVCVFNGRMDATRAILEAAKAAGIRVVSVERTWFGNGLQLYPEENCLGLKTVDRMVLEWRDKPLTKNQAVKAASYIALRFLGTNNNEWRAYNKDAQFLPWPVKDARRKILLTPGSRNEIWGHPDWKWDWAEPAQSYDALITQLDLSNQDLVLRCHPNWGEKIGKNDGYLPEKYYTDWANKRGIHVIPSTNKTSTLNLIEQCDAVVVTNGSAALEAGILGKQVIAIGPSSYQAAGFRTDCTSPETMKHLVLHVGLDGSEQEKISREISRLSLRFCYTMAHRVAQYVSDVKCESTTHYLYSANSDPAKFIDLLKSGVVRADDEIYANDCLDENVILEKIYNKSWTDFISTSMVGNNEAFYPIKRRWMYRAIDRLRQLFPVGDR